MNQESRNYNLELLAAGEPWKATIGPTSGFKRGPFPGNRGSSGQHRFCPAHCRVWATWEKLVSWCFENARRVKKKKKKKKKVLKVQLT